MSTPIHEPPPRQYRPGDVANGHVLQKDGRWAPFQGHPPVSDGYRKRYARRWPRTGLVMAVITALATLAQPGATDLPPVALIIDLALALTAGGLLNGSVVNLVVAMFPSRKSTSPYARCAR